MRAPHGARRWAVAAVLVPLAALAILSAPRPDPAKLRARQARWVSAAPGVEFSFCADSGLFMAAAERPGRVLMPRFRYQSRPLLFYAAHAIGRSLRALAPSASLGLPTVHGWWLPYLPIPFAGLLAAVLLFEGAVDPPSRAYPVTAILSIPLVLNEVVRWFLWSPHTQLCTVLAPVLCLFLARRMLDRPTTPAPALAAALGTGIGVLVLAYGAFAVCLPVALACLWWRGADRGGSRLAASLALLLGGIAPTALWYLVVYAEAGVVHSAEIVAFRQFVWPLDALAHGRLAEALGRAAFRFFVMTSLATWFPLVLIALAAVLTRRAGLSVSAALRRRPAEASAVLVTLGAEAVFLYLLGFYRVRLEWAFVPPLLALANVLAASAWPSLPPRDRRAAVVIGVLLVGAWVAHVLTQDPPA